MSHAEALRTQKYSLNQGGIRRGLPAKRRLLTLIAELKVMLAESASGTPPTDLQSAL
jgi:hypothetical protein